MLTTLLVAEAVLVVIGKDKVKNAASLLGLRVQFSFSSLVMLSS